MKIGIVTFNSAHNYGAVLQAWSLQTYLEKEGHEVDIINFRPWVIDDVYAMAKKKKFSANKNLNKIINKARVIKRCVNDPQKLLRYRRFEKFINNKLNVTKVYRKGWEIKIDESLKYDVLIAGSDQIWNSEITKKIDSVYFLNFGQPETKRISYAASIGGKELPEVEQELFRNYLKKLDYISVREENAYKVLQPLVDKKIKVVSDPTFLLKRDDFDKLKKTYPVKKTYIYVHNVHLVREDIELNEVAEELSKRTGLPIISNRKEKYFSNEAGKFLTGSPEQFIGVISEAEYVVTNSFHATVFAIIYQRNFITVPHYSNPDRMQNLLNELGIANHLMYAGEDIPKDLKAFDIDYKIVECRKEEMGVESRSFLKEALEGQKTDGYQKGVVYEKAKMYLAAGKRRHIYIEETLNDLLLPMVEQILKKKGKFVLPIYNNDMSGQYIMTDDIAVMKRAMFPEIFEVNEAGIYEEVEHQLEQGTEILFIGNGCQIFRFKEQIKKEYQNLTLIELTCHGLVDEAIREAYFIEMEKEYNSKITDFEPRNKFRKPNENFMVYSFASGAVNVEATFESDLGYAMRNNNVQKNICYSCIQRAREDSYADIILGLPEEYRGLRKNKQENEFMDEKEGGVFYIKSDKGIRLWESVQDEYEMIPLSKEKIRLARIDMPYVRNKIEQSMKKGENIKEILQQKNFGKERKKKK